MTRYAAALRSLLCAALAVLLAAPASAKDRPTQGLRYPALTPDNKSVVFCYRGDIWIASIDGKGRADRLTIHEEQETLCRVSPDGTKIAFASKRNGAYDIFVVPVEGGMPEQVTHHSAVEVPCRWSPDGKKLLFMSNRDGDLDLYEVDLENGGTPRRVTFAGGAREGAYAPDGKSIVYARGFNSIYWDDYEGSANYDLYVVPVDGGTPRRLTDTAGNERYPFFSADGSEIYFVGEEKGVASFYAMPAAGGAPRRLTEYGGKEKLDVHRPDLGWDHKTVVFELAGQLYYADLADPGEKPTPIPLSIRSDVRSSGIRTRTLTSGGEQVHVSHDGRRVAFSLRGDIWTMPANGGKGRVVVSGPGQEQWPRFSPDGTHLAYFSNEEGNDNIYVIELKTSRKRRITRHAANDFFHAWSPDGSRLVFCSERTGNREIWSVELATGALQQLTNHPAADDDPVYSPDGGLIAFDSGRDGSQAIYVMNADGSDPRRVAQSVGFLQVPNFSPDGKLLVYEMANPTTGGSAGLYVSAVAGGPSMQIARDGSTACWSPQGDYIYFTAERGPASGVFRVKAPTSIMAGERIPFIGEVEVDNREELEKVFDEAWTALRNGFYDAKMHGVDWNAMRKKYRAMAVDAENKDEFHNVVRQMLAELGASHLGIGGGARDTGVAPDVAQTGYLGLELDVEPVEEGFRVRSILAGGPAEQAGLRVGDVVSKVGARELKKDTNLDEVLAGTVGKEVKVTFRPLTGEGLGLERTIGLKAIDFGAFNNLREEAWVATCRRRVEAATTKDTKVGYLHLSRMDGENLRKFQEAVQSWNHDEKVRGMILDVRNNGGGNIHLQLMQVLVNEPLARVNMRNGREMIQPPLYWDKPVVLLINERSFSDAEVFPFMFKEAEVGTVIGVPTAGGVIGTNDITLSDGSTFRIPRTGFWSLDGANLEGLGVEPHIRVEMTVEDHRQGRDPQLAKAIEVVKEQIAERREAEEAAKAKKKAEAGEKKAEQPEKKPDEVPEPATPLEGTAESPLVDARVGEWVRYRMTSLDGAESVVKVSVVRVSETAVEFEKEIEKGAPMLPPLPDKIRPVKVLDAMGLYGEVLGHTVVYGEVADADAEILQVQLRMADGSEVQLSFTNVIPAYGLWKVELGKHVLMEAIEWGAPRVAETGPAGDSADSAGSGEEDAKDADVPAHPMLGAKEGEWAKFRRRIPNGQELEEVVRVVEVTDDEIVVEREIEFQGQKRKSPPLRQEKRPTLAPPDGTEATYAKDTVRVAGALLECIVMTQTRDGHEQKRWYSTEVPVGGLVKIEVDGVVVAELVDWGRE